MSPHKNNFVIPQKIKGIFRIEFYKDHYNYMTIGLEVVKLFYKHVHSSVLEEKHRDLALKGGSIAYPTHSYKPTLTKRLAIT